MAAMADFARLPTRQKVMVFVVIGAVLGFLYHRFVYTKLRDDLQAAEGDHASKKQLSAKLEADIPEFDRLKARMVPLQRMIEENQRALPTEAELPAFFETLNRKVLESGVEVVRSTQNNEEKIESFIKVPISYEIQGTFVQIKKFFASLLPKKKRAAQPEGAVNEEQERIVSIENLSLSNPVVRNREIHLTAKFTASTYRQEEKKGGKPAAKPGQPAGATPPTSTPKGAKAAAEKGVDQGDARNRDATGVKEAKTPGSGVERMKGGL